MGNGKTGAASEIVKNHMAYFSMKQLLVVNLYGNELYEKAYM